MNGNVGLLGRVVWNAFLISVALAIMYVFVWVMLGS